MKNNKSKTLMYVWLVLLKEIVKDNSISVMQEKESYIRENFKS
jgi:hypothetical protein